MSSQQPHRQARRRLKLLGKTLTGAVDGWTDSEDELFQEGKVLNTIDLCSSRVAYSQILLHDSLVNIKSVRIGDVVMPVESALNPELVPEHEGPLYDDSQVKKTVPSGISREFNCHKANLPLFNLLPIGNTTTLAMVKLKWTKTVECNCSLCRIFVLL